MQMGPMAQKMLDGAFSRRCYYDKNKYLLPLLFLRLGGVLFEGSYSDSLFC